MSQYITITSSTQNPCDFVSNFTDAVNLYDGYEVAVTKIFHAPAYNVTEHNNKFTLIKEQALVDYYIPVGHYAGTCDVLEAIYKVLLKSMESGENAHGSGTLVLKEPLFLYAKGMGEASSLKIMDVGVKFLIDNARDDNAMVLKLLGYCMNARIDKININHYAFDVSMDAGFLYSNIVANSLINQQQSRLLALIPIRSKAGYNYCEFEKPVYTPLSVHSFTDIAFKLTDVNGSMIRMAHTYSASWGNVTRILYPTIITLHIRKIYK